MLNFRMNMPFYLMAFYGSVMILAVLLLRGLLRNKLPKFVFPVLWSVIVLRLMVPFSLSSPLSLKIPEFFMNFLIEFPLETATLNAVAEDILAEPMAVEGTAGIAQSAENTISTGETTFAISYDDFSTRGWQKILYFVFFGGILCTAAILLWQKHRYTKHLKDSLLIEHNETVNALLRDMGMGHILVFSNDEIASPLVCGLRAPRIYLPTRMDFANTEFLRHILCHETMHIRRKDNWVKSAMLLTLCVHWFNPLVWVMAKCLASDLETACDEAVLRLYNDDDARKSYAFSLLSMSVTGNRPTLLYSAFSKTEVEKRIQNIVHYKKASAALLALSVCLVLSGTVASATGGQAPFSPYLSAFCSSDVCRWGIRAYLTRGAALGENAQQRAENIIFDMIEDDDDNKDPDVLENKIKNALADEFHVEPSAFAVDVSLCLNREDFFKEYAVWGLVRKEKESDVLQYNDETIRTFSDEMLGRYYSQQEGAVDITVVRNRLSEITSVTVYREGDAEFDRRTRDIERRQHQYSFSQNTAQTTSTAVHDNVVEETAVTLPVFTH